MFGSIFRYKGTLWRVLSNLTDILALSALWLLCSLPLITAGAAATALYDSVCRCVRYGEEGPYGRFFRTFKAELLTASLSTLLWGLVAYAGLNLLGMLKAMSAESESAALAFYVYLFVLVLPLGAACWAFPILSRFSFGFGALNVTAFKFAIAHLPSSFALVLLCYGIMYLSAQFVLALVVAPALLMLLWSLFIEPVFAKHGGGLERAVSTEDMGELNED